jgi:K+-transporting ATPase KdpF subunit
LGWESSLWHFALPFFGPAKGFERTMLTYLTAIVAAFLFVYLWVAVIRPEKF